MNPFFHCHRRPVRRRRGQALLEAAVTIPFLLLLLLNAVNFGFYLYAWVTVNNAARAIAEYRVYNGVAVGFPPAPTLGQLNCVLYNEVSTLPNRGTGSNCVWGNVSLRICGNKNGTLSCIGSGTYTPPADVEPTRFQLYSAEVSYTFRPPFPPFILPVIGQPVSILPTKISRHVVMRAMQ